MVYQKFPTVTVVNVADVMQIVEDVVQRIAAVIRFISGFTILAGAVMVASSVAGTRFRRMREVVTLKTLGATRRRIAWIFSVEFLALGTVAGLMGSLLAGGFAALVLKRLLQIDFHPALVTHALAVAIAALVATVAGWARQFPHPGQETAGDSARRIGGRLWYDSSKRSTHETVSHTRSLSLYLSVSRPAFAPADDKSVNPKIQEMMGQVSEARIKAILEKLESFGTRNTMSNPDDPVRGVGAARTWILNEMTELQPEAAGALREVPREEAGAADFQGRRPVQRGGLPAGEEDAGDAWSW